MEMTSKERNGFYMREWVWAVCVVGTYQMGLVWCQSNVCITFNYPKIASFNPPQIS
jgi:hypothetical protein